jgi:hypothetical protein
VQNGASNYVSREMQQSRQTTTADPVASANSRVEGRAIDLTIALALRLFGAPARLNESSAANQSVNRLWKMAGSRFGIGSKSSLSDKYSKFVATTAGKSEYIVER